MESTGILVIECCPRLNICILLPQFQPLLVTPIQLVDFLANEEITRARDAYIVARAKGNYSKFVRDHLQGYLVGRMVFLFPYKIKFLPRQFIFHISI